MAAELVRLLDQHHRMTEAGRSQGRLEPGEAAADHQHRVVHLLVEGLGELGFLPGGPCPSG